MQIISAGTNPHSKFSSLASVRTCVHEETRFLAQKLHGVLEVRMWLQSFLQRFSDKNTCRRHEFGSPVYLIDAWLLMKEYVAGIYMVRDLFKSLSSEGIEPPVSWSLPGQQKEPSQLLICSSSFSSTKGGWLFLYLLQAMKSSCQGWLSVVTEVVGRTLANFLFSFQ